MIYATTPSSDHTPATPGGRATCPGCGVDVIAKCGHINVWHWAHVTGEDCDPWWEPVSEWHLGWQRLVPVNRREVRIGAHRADLLAHDGTVVEVQHSSLAVDDIRARERHYRRMVWIFDARDAYADDRLEVRDPAEPRYAGQVNLRWKHPRKSIAACRATVLLDIGDPAALVRVLRLFPEAPCGGYGDRVQTARVIRWIQGADTTTPSLSDHVSRRLTVTTPQGAHR